MRRWASEPAEAKHGFKKVVPAAVKQMEAAFSVEILEGPRARLGMPDKFNTEHGSQFVGRRLPTRSVNNNIAISMNSTRVLLDHVLVRKHEVICTPAKASPTRHLNWPISRSFATTGAVPRAFRDPGSN